MLIIFSELFCALNSRQSFRISGFVNVSDLARLQEYNFIGSPVGFNDLILVDSAN